MKQAKILLINNIIYVNILIFVFYFSTKNSKTMKN